MEEVWRYLCFVLVLPSTGVRSRLQGRVPPVEVPVGGERKERESGDSGRQGERK